MLYDVYGNEISTVYDVDGETIESAYDVDGAPIEGENPVDYSDYTFTDLFTYVADGFDGFDVHKGVIAQLMASNKLYLFDLENHTAIATALAITSGHGDSASFSRQKQYINDEFPLLYVTSDSNPATVYINRITRTGATLIKTLSFPLDKTGYYAAHAYDLENQIMYMVGYSKQNYLTDDSGNNKTVVSKWDMTQLTDNGNGTFTPSYISRYERAFIYVMQGLQYHDGYIWISSGYNNGGNQYVYAMNPTDGTIEHTILLDDHVEIEGLAWIYDESENKYWMLIGQQNGASGINYSRIDFATASD